MSTDRLDGEHDIWDLSVLNDQQRETLVARGLITIELVHAVAVSQPAALAAMLGCSPETVDELINAAEAALKADGKDQNRAEAPPIPSFGLVPPEERSNNQPPDKSEGAQPC